MLGVVEVGVLLQPTFHVALRSIYLWDLHVLMVQHAVVVQLSQSAALRDQLKVYGIHLQPHQRR